MPLLFKTEIRKSNIHGYGLFCLENVPKGKIFWIHDPILDGWIDPISLEKYPHLTDHANYWYCYDKELKLLIRSSDSLPFINHSFLPNLWSPTKYKHITACDIEAGEELTLNYDHICDEGYLVTGELKYDANSKS